MNKERICPYRKTKVCPYKEKGTKTCTHPSCIHILKFNRRTRTYIIRARIRGE